MQCKRPNSKVLPPHPPSPSSWRRRQHDPTPLSFSMEKQKKKHLPGCNHLGAKRRIGLRKLGKGRTLCGLFHQVKGLRWPEVQRCHVLVFGGTSLATFAMEAAFFLGRWRLDGDVFCVKATQRSFLYMNIQLNICIYDHLCIFMYHVIRFFSVSAERGRRAEAGYDTMSNLFILQKLFETKTCLSRQLPFNDIHGQNNFLKNSRKILLLQNAIMGWPGVEKKGEDSWIFWIQKQ